LFVFFNVIDFYHGSYTEELICRFGLE